ncbi:15775_t:CDS:2, partial [Dentiscutata heterogama]
YEFINIFKRDPKVTKHIMQLHKLHLTRKEEEEKVEIKKELYYKSSYELDDFWVPKIIFNWIKENLFTKKKQYKSIMIVGNTRLGKTALFRSLKLPHIYYCKLRESKQWNNNAKYVILDDIDFFKHNGDQKRSIMDTYREMLFCQEEFNLRTAYSKTIKNKGNFDLRKKDEDGNLTNESLRYGGSVVISYIDKDGDEKELVLTLEDFEYDKMLNYENGGNGKRRMSYDENERESENIKRGIFANENIVNEWYNAVKELQRLNPAQEKFAIEKVDSNWYTLPHSDHIIQLIYNVHEKDGGGGSGSGGGNSTGNPNNPGSNSGSGNTSGNPGSNTGQGGNPTGGNGGSASNNNPTGGGSNTGGSNPNESGANKPPNNSGSGLNQKQKLALDEIFKNLQMQRTDNDDNDLEELRKVSQRLAELLNMQN